MEGRRGMVGLISASAVTHRRGTVEERGAASLGPERVSWGESQNKLEVTVTMSQQQITKAHKISVGTCFFVKAIDCPLVQILRTRFFPRSFYPDKIVWKFLTANLSP